MSIQPTHTPAQQAVRDAIQAWRDGPDSPLTQAEWAGFGGASGRLEGPHNEATPGRIAANRGSDRTPKRIQRKRTRGWKMPEGAVYVGRPSVFGNPAVIELDRSIRNTVNPWHLWAGDIGPGLGWFTTQRDARDAATRYFREWLATPDGVVKPRNAFLDDAPTLAYCTAHREIHERLPDLAGRDLACWCPLDQPCHADVLLEIANRGDA